MSHFRTQGQQSDARRIKEYVAWTIVGTVGKLQEQCNEGDKECFSRLELE
jgi:hypothetical protein